MKKKGTRRLSAALAALLAASCGVWTAHAQTVSLTDAMYEKATAFAPGDLTRIAAVLRKAQRGEPVTVGVIGGSITQGSCATRPENRYANRVVAWFEQTFPASRVTLVNAGIGATDSYLAVHRVQKDLLAAQPDLVVVEFSVNDLATYFFKKSYDNLVRRILSDPRMPAVLLLFMTMEDGTSAQTEHANIGFRYGVPMISYGGAVLDAIKTGQLMWTDISADNIHPNDAGHALAASLITRFLDSVRQRLDELTGEPAPFDKPAATKACYLDARLENALSLSPRETSGFTVGNYFQAFPNGWRLSAGALTFEVTAANVGVLYLRETSGEAGVFDVLVDGKPAAAPDGDFSGGWGDYAAALEVFSSGETAPHTVTILPRNGKRVTLLGLLLS